MNIFDIYIAYVTWGSGGNKIAGGKKRPVLILEQTAGGVTVFNITTRYEGKSEIIRSKYFKINDWQQAGLHEEPRGKPRGSSLERKFIILAVLRPAFQSAIVC